MTISKDNVKPSPQPDSWKLIEIFSTGVMLRGYQALMTVVFFWAMIDTDCFLGTYSYSQFLILGQFKKLTLLRVYLEHVWCETIESTS